MQRTTIILFIIAIVSKGLGFFREIILSYFYGASNISDAYLMSLTIPGIIFTFIAVGISTNYIPLYIEASNDNRKIGENFTNNLLNSTFIICTIIVFVGYLFMEESIRIFAPGFDIDTISMTIEFTRISLFSVYFTAMVYIFSGYLQANKKYIIPALISIPFNILMVLGIYISYKYNYLLLAIGSVLAVVCEGIFLFLFMCKQGYKYKLKIDIKDHYLKKLILLSVPVIIGVSVNQINTLIDKTLASQISTGAISALNYADKLILAIQAIFVSSIITVMYPRVSRLALEKNFEKIKQEILNNLNTLNLIMVPISFICIFFCEEIIRLLFGRGAFDENAIKLTSQALFFYGMGMIAVATREVFSKVFYALQDTKRPMINAAIAMVLNIILNIILSRRLGVGGLALATSISAIVCVILLFVQLHKKLGYINIFSYFVETTKIVISTMSMIITSKIIYGIINFRSETNLIISIIVGMAIYVLMVLILRVKEIHNYIEMIKRWKGKSG